MKVKKPLSILHYGNKGFIFSLDALLAVLIFIILLTSSSYIISKGNEPLLPKMQLSRMENDLVTLLDQAKYLDTLTPDTIQTEINEVIPTKRYGFRLNLTWQYLDSTDINSFVIGDEIPSNKFIANGKKFFLATNDYETNLTAFGVARYWIWLR